MTKILLGTVSALALTVAVSGMALARDHHDRDDNGAKSANAAAASVTVASVDYNAAAGTLVTGENEIDDHAFSNAAGAFNVGQNRSINSNVQQSMAIAAVVGEQAREEGALAASVGADEVRHDATIFSAVVGDNEVEDHAFQGARGAFQVLQNRSINGNVSQSLAIGASVGDDGQNFNSGALSASVLDGSVSGNIALAAAVTLGHNVITDHAFENAKGAFNVMQNASLNSNVQQSLSIGAVVNSR